MADGYDPILTLADLVAGARNQPGTGLIARDVIRSLGLPEQAPGADIELALRAAITQARPGRRHRTPRQVEAAVDRLYTLAKGSVDKTWMNPRQLLGPVLYRALLGEELLRLLAAQDESISADQVRAMADGFWARICTDAEVNGDA
jgi:hypothetical protein